MKMKKKNNFGAYEGDRYCSLLLRFFRLSKFLNSSEEKYLVSRQYIFQNIFTVWLQLRNQWYEVSMKTAKIIVNSSVQFVNLGNFLFSYKFGCITFFKLRFSESYTTNFLFDKKVPFLLLNQMELFIKRQTKVSKFGTLSNNISTSRIVSRRKFSGFQRVDAILNFHI